mgnify:CR=1 FL=1
MFFCVLEEGPLVDVDVSSKVAVTGGEDTGRSPPPRHGGADAADALGPPRPPPLENETGWLLN